MKVCNKTNDKKKWIRAKNERFKYLLCNSIGDNDVVKRLKDLKLKLASGENIEIEAKIEKISTIKEKTKDTPRKMEKPVRTKRVIIPKERKFMLLEIKIYN